MTSRLRPPLEAHEHIAGNLAAPITLVEFGDYECPFSADAHVTVELLQEQLGDRLCFAFRNFPLAAVHPHALGAAEAAEAADAQGRFWQMHHTLYENQEALGPTNLLEYAARLGLDWDLFQNDLRTHRFRDKVHADVRSGALSGVTGTPTFFINGARHDGGYDFDSLWYAIAGATGAELR